MEINITELFYQCEARLYSASKAELGDDAGKITWNNACEAAKEYNSLDTKEKREAFKSFVRESGGWNQEEIDRWSFKELNALFIQWVSGDMREAGLDVPSPDWEQYAKESGAGNCSSRIWRGPDNEVYFYIGN